MPPRRPHRALLSLGLWVAIATAHAQAPLVPAAPMTATAPLPAPPGSALARFADGQRAQDIGYPAEAARIFRDLAAQPGTAVNPTQLRLALSAALLDEGDIPAADAVLQEEPAATRRGPWHLRAGLVAAKRRNWPLAAEELELARPDVPPAESAWGLYLEGLIADAAGEWKRAEDFYTRAEAPATSDSARARFKVAGWDAALRLRTVTDEQFNAARTDALRPGPAAPDYDIRLRYGMMLAARGQTAEAISFLQAQVRALAAAPVESARLDLYQVILGLIADKSVGPNSAGPGRNVLYLVLGRAADPTLQRAALQILARASTSGDERNDFKRELDVLLTGAPRAPEAIRPDLLLFRAELGAQDKDYARADADAREILEKYAGSPLRATALGVLVSTSWEGQRYSNAAAYATDARKELPPGPARAALGLLLAEAYFRTGYDFRAAADAYRDVAGELPPGVALGDVLFQRILSETRAAELKAGQLTSVVVPIVDEIERNPGFDARNRWEAEWNLADALMGVDEGKVAYARITRLLDRPANGAGLETGLRARLKWLQLRLALEIEDYPQALQLAEEVKALVDRAEPAAIEPTLRAELLSHTELLRGKAQIKLGQEADSVATFDALRKAYPASGAAISSIIEQADYFEAKGNLVEAEKLLIRLSTDFPASEYAPLALLKSAYLAKERDLPLEAYNRLEQLVKTYPNTEYYGGARLMQGDLMVGEGDLPRAELLFEEVIQRSLTANENTYIARLRRADIVARQAATQTIQRARAIDLYRGLVVAVAAPVRVRIEAGFKLGNLHVLSGEFLQAQQVWFDQVIQPNLDNPDTVARAMEGGRHYLALTMVALGDLYLNQGKKTEAENTWNRLLRANLSDEASQLARTRLGLASPGVPK